jgi:prepilin-type N-terminal cleavage/methylation domain-containing protein
MSTFSRLCRSFFKQRSLRGFTLIELLVVSMIIVLITAFVLFRQQGFNSSTLLRSLSYSVALSMRQAQVYGVSVRESASGSGVFAPGYGVYFGNSELVDQTHYLVFADLNGDGNYATGEELPRYTIGNGRGTDYSIKNFCAHSVTLGDKCGGSGITKLTIYFKRPNPDACFATDQATGACAPGGTPVYDYAYVQLKAAGSTDYRTVKITSTGQIEVCALNVAAAAC